MTREPIELSGQGTLYPVQLKLVGRWVWWVRKGDGRVFGGSVDSGFQKRFGLYGL